jgi:hypothetical protein
MYLGLTNYMKAMHSGHVVPPCPQDPGTVYEGPLWTKIRGNKPAVNWLLTNC